MGVANCWTFRAGKIAKDKAHKTRHENTSSAITTVSLDLDR